LRYGNADTLKGQTATADLLGPMLLRGTATRTRQQIEDELDKLNTTLNIGGQPGVLTVSLSSKKKYLPDALKLLGEVLRSPAFPAAEFEIVKRESYENTLKGITEPQMLAMTELRRKLAPYGKDDARYVPTLEETLAIEKAVTLDQVKALYEAQLGSQAGELAVVGAFDPDTTLSQIDAFLKGWANKVPYARLTREYKPVTAGTQTINTPDKANAIFLGALSLNVSDSDPEYAALVVGNYLLGSAPLASRLSNRVRGKDGLSYGVMSQVEASSLDKVGALIVFAICNPNNMPKVDAAILEEVTKFVKEGVSASELEEAKKAYVQNLKTMRANDGALAGQLVKSLQSGRTFDYYADLEKKVEALQPGDIKKAFDKAVDAGKLSIIQAGDLKKAEKK
jgi:zinc protease